MRRSAGPLVAAASFSTVAATVLVLAAPLLLAGLVVLVVLLIAVSKVGLRNALIVAGILITGFSALIARYIPAAGDLNSVGTAFLIVVGVGSLSRAGIDRRIALPGSLFLGLASIAAVASFLTTENLEYALRGLIALVAAPLTVVAVSSALRRADPSAAPRIRFLFLVSIATVILANIVFGLRQAIFGLTSEEIRSAVEGVSTFSVGNQIRLMGTFQSNQDMGLFLACLAPGLLAAGLRASGRARAWFVVVAALLYVVNFLSLTRTSLVAGVIVGVLALVIWSRGEVILRTLRNLALVFAGAAALLGVLVVLGVPRVQSAIDRALTLSDLAADGSFNDRRESTLPIAWAAFSNNLLGAGAGSAGPVSQQFAEDSPLGYTNADNGYLMIGIQMGVIGLILFVWLLFAVVAVLGRHGTALRTAGAAGTVALIIAMLTAGYWSLLAPICLVAAVVGIALTEPREPLNGPPSPVFEKRRVTGGEPRATA